ncbi:hypothetical protein GCM10009616_07350 [Microlunatus lacustris]
MTARVSTHPSRWSRSAVPAVRRWIVIPLLLGLLGGLAGAAAGSVSRASAEALLLVQTDTSTGISNDLAAENAAVQLSTREIFTAAAEESGGDARDLQARSEVVAVPNSQIVSITITAPTAEQAVAETDAVAAAAVAAGPNRTPQALEQLTAATRDLIEADDLGDSSAEQARIDRLGDALGAAQAALVASANQLQLLQSAEPNNRLPGGPVLGLLGALSGALLGLAAALLLGVRRGTVKSARDLADLYPRAAVINASDLAQTMEIERDAQTVIVAGTRGAKLSTVTQTVQDALAATGKRIVRADSLAGAPVGEPPNGHINLVTTTLSETVLRRASRDEGSVLIVPVQPQVTKLEAVDEFASRLADRSYLLVDNRAPEWD